ncbi:MAG: EAL domain-containing protein [Sulfuricurvum sp.]|jgi:diguanylate cyclase (GGDEF)-like protein/PAS domain S-box-containing protein
MLKNKFDKIVLFGTFIFFLLGVSLFSYYEYQKHKTTLYQHIDEKLLASAAGTNLLLGPDFHDRALDVSSITQNEYNHNIGRLSEFAKSLHVAYLYTMVQKNNKIYFTASSATDEERRTGKNLTRYFDHYDDASDALNTVFLTHRISFDEYTDKWGNFRSVFIPLKTPNGHFYVIAADIKIDDINNALREETLFLLARILILLAVSLPFLTSNLRRINNTLHQENETLIEHLKNEQHHLLNILWGTDAGTWEWNIQTGKNRVNDMWAQMLGYTLEELSPVTYTTFESLCHPDDLPKVREELQHLFSGGLTHYESDLRMRHKKGHWVWIHVRGRVISYDREGKPLLMAGIHLDITEKKEAEERIQYLAKFDLLTGLPNRIQLEERITYSINFAKRHHQELSIMFLDLDHFKNINDTLGHRIGDILLVKLAERFHSILREEDTVSRTGGDEFIFVLPQADAKGAALVAQKILNSIVHPFDIEQNELIVTASIGIAVYPMDGTDHETLSKNADTAMYRAKQEGRNAYAFFTEALQVHSMRTLQLSNELHHALERNQLYVVYQPQISLSNGHILGVEALLRWEHPEFGTLSPSEFIPIAEDNGLILPIGEWVLRTAVSQVKTWQESGLPPIVMAVNLSAVQFRHPNLPDLVTQILHEEGLPPEYLELELTEGMAMHDPQSAIAIMKNLHERGIRMSIDDFGTGYSSLAYLKKFNVYKLKIDKSFIDDITTDPDDKAIVSTIISMAHNLGLQTIAEGVETAQQREYLFQLGCNEVQGYYYSKPLLPNDYVLFAQSHAKTIELEFSI